MTLKMQKLLQMKSVLRLKIIDPLSENWLKATTDIINALHNSLIESSK